MTPARYKPPCRSVTSPEDDLWYSPDPADRDLAKRICGTCLQRAGCAEAGRGEVWGVWGAIDTEQREAARLTAEMAAGVLEVAEVHDRPRYVRGCRCGVCTAANTAWIAAYRERPAVVTEPATIDLQMELFEGAAG